MAVLNSIDMVAWGRSHLSILAQASNILISSQAHSFPKIIAAESEDMPEAVHVELPAKLPSVKRWSKDDAQLR
ncbi:MAG: hypothetical protein HY785_00400 [Oscillatoriophycideae cyanobacterium NC_groundwater_1537_Pr4_S-0.65um_50_18]|nr:hypothetical protein [Oscillatoriophycideae cyanobacterium NC_groundwater_1537_Pr4_S-0.65um_50_18]